MFCKCKGIEVVCVTEHWLTEKQINLFVSKDFVVAGVDN